MSIKLYNCASLGALARAQGYSESSLARAASVSRLTIRSLLRGGNSESETVAKVAAALNVHVSLLIESDEVDPSLSSYGVGMRVLQDGAETWKIHYMNLVDEFRRSLDTRLILLPPPKRLPLRERAMLASIVCQLCDEARATPPAWAARRMSLEDPWFVSETESLKASALLESPLRFRRNNIFVLSNFLERV